MEQNEGDIDLFGQVGGQTARFAQRRQKQVSLLRIIRVSRKLKPRYKPQRIPILIQRAVREPVPRAQSGALQKCGGIGSPGGIGTRSADDKRVDVGKIGPRARQCLQNSVEVG